MNAWKKVGLTALAGSMVALSAQAGEMTVGGYAKLTYTGDTGAQDNSTDGNRFGMQQFIDVTGSGELDNGFKFTLYHSGSFTDDTTNSADSNGMSTSFISLDMGSMGTIKFNQQTGNLGIDIIDDMMPTADEEITNGLTTSGSATPTGQASHGKDGFNYTNSLSDGQITAHIGYTPKGDKTQDDGANGGTGTNSDKSFAVIVKPAMADGLELGFGMGDIGTATSEDEHDTAYVKYAYGPVTVGYQVSNIDYAASATADLENTKWGIGFNVNDNLSLSYGEGTTEASGSVDEEVEGISVAYSMGGMTLKAHKNKGKNLGNSASQESEHTEIALSLAF